MLWKVVEAIINTSLWDSIQFHGVFHRFCAGRGMGTETMELNISQDLSSVDQYPLLVVFLELRKTYNTVDRGRLVRTL